MIANLFNGFHIENEAQSWASAAVIILAFGSNIILGSSGPALLATVNNPASIDHVQYKHDRALQRSGE